MIRDLIILAVVALVAAGFGMSVKTDDPATGRQPAKSIPAGELSAFYTGNTEFIDTSVAIASFNRFDTFWNINQRYPKFEIFKLSEMKLYLDSLISQGADYVVIRNGLVQRQGQDSVVIHVYGAQRTGQHTFTAVYALMPNTTGTANRAVVLEEGYRCPPHCPSVQ